MSARSDRIAQPERTIAPRLAPAGSPATAETSAAGEATFTFDGALDYVCEVKRTRRGAAGCRLQRRHPMIFAPVRRGGCTAWARSAETTRPRGRRRSLIETVGLLFGGALRTEWSAIRPSSRPDLGDDVGHACVFLDARQTEQRAGRSARRAGGRKVYIEPFCSRPCQDTPASADR